MPVLKKRYGMRQTVCLFEVSLAVSICSIFRFIPFYPATTAVFHMMSTFECKQNFFKNCREQ